MSICIVQVWAQIKQTASFRPLLGLEIVMHVISTAVFANHSTTISNSAFIFQTQSFMEIAKSILFHLMSPMQNILTHLRKFPHNF